MFDKSQKINNMQKRINSIQEVDLSGIKVPMIPVYRQPEDFPDHAVARVFDLDQPTDTIMVRDTVEEIQLDLRKHSRLTFIPRSSGDVPALMGVWM